MKIYVKLWRKTEISWLPVQAFLREGLKMPCSVAIILIAVIVAMGICGDLAFEGIFYNFGHSNGHSMCVFSPDLSALRAADKEALCRLHVWEPWPEGACVWRQRNWDSPSWQLPCCFQGTFQTIPSITSLTRSPPNTKTKHNSHKQEKLHSLGTDQPQNRSYKESTVITQMNKTGKARKIYSIESLHFVIDCTFSSAIPFSTDFGAFH